MTGMYSFSKIISDLDGSSTGLRCDFFCHVAYALCAKAILCRRHLLECERMSRDWKSVG